MDRRQFAALVVALYAGKATAEIAARHPLLLEDARTNDFGPSQEFDALSWPASPITDEQLADAGVYPFTITEEQAEAIQIVEANSRAVQRLTRSMNRLVRHA